MGHYLWLVMLSTMIHGVVISTHIYIAVAYRLMVWFA